MVIFIATMYRSAVKLATPMLFALGSLAIFVIGALLAWFNSSLSLGHCPERNILRGRPFPLRYGRRFTLRAVWSNLLLVAEDDWQNAQRILGKVALHCFNHRFST